MNYCLIFLIFLNLEAIESGKLDYFLRILCCTSKDSIVTGGSFSIKGLESLKLENGTTCL